MRIILIAWLALISQLAMTAESPAPDFILKSTSGENLRLSEQRGQVVLINFWASWCGPCRQEMPLLDELQQKYSKLGFTVFGVNVDKDPAKADKILKDIPVSFPVLYDSDGNVSKLFDVSAMPTTVIVDRDGNMRYLHKGFKPGYEDKYAANIKALIRE
ncbi:MAG: TlpA disulfide reductase family protein [Oceanicoccus sp.]